MRRLITVFGIICLFFVCNGAEIRRQKRALWQFSDMIACTTAVSYADVLSLYNGYGCYCGYGGSGTPVDALDTCCKEHDTCYENLRTGNTCDVLDLYSMSYKYSTNRCGRNRSSITCTPASEYGSTSFFGFNLYPNPKCAAALCDCDAKAAKCFARQQYNTEFKYHDRTQC